MGLIRSTFELLEYFNCIAVENNVHCGARFEYHALVVEFYFWSSEWDNRKISPYSVRIDGDDLDIDSHIETIKWGLVKYVKWIQENLESDGSDFPDRISN